MIRRKTNPFRMLPVMSDMRPTMAGPTKDADLSVRAKREKKDDSWFYPSGTRQNRIGERTGGISSAYTARL